MNNWDVLEAAFWNQVILQHDNNARPHFACGWNKKLWETWRLNRFHILQYSPHIVPCDFYFLPILKRGLKGNHYSSHNEVKTAIPSWVREKLKEFFCDGMKKLFPVMEWKNSSLGNLKKKYFSETFFGLYEAYFFVLIQLYQFSRNHTLYSSW